MGSFSHQSGYTLMEVLVVLAIMGLIAAFAVPTAARTIDNVTLQSDARTVVVKLRQLENAAIETQQVVTVSGSDALTVSTGDTLSASGSSDVRLVGTNEISFYPDGTSSGGSIAVERGSQTIVVEVAWLSGDIAVKRP